MTFRACLLIACFSAMTALSSSAAMIYSNLASFNAAINTGTAFTNPFTTAPGPNPQPAQNYAANGFAYTLSTAPGNQLFFDPTGFVGVNNASNALVVTVTSGNVSAIGGNFFQTDLNGLFLNAPITLTLSDGTIDTFTPTGTNDFRGYTTGSGVFISSLTIPGYVGPGLPVTFSALDNLVVGQALIGPAAEAVPVPATAIIGLAALPVLGVLRRRRG